MKSLTRFRRALLVLSAGSVVGLIAASPASAGMGFCAGHPATIRGTQNPDFIRATDGSDVIRALGGGDSVHALDGNDVVCGGPGSDALVGAGGDDVLIWGATPQGGFEGGTGGSGDDYLTLEATDVSADPPLNIGGGSGDDLFFGSAVRDIFSGGSGDDEAAGFGGDDLFFGGSGDDRLEGGEGADFANGGADFDLCTAEGHSNCESASPG